MNPLSLLGNPAPPTAVFQLRQQTPVIQRGGVGPGKGAKNAAPGKPGPPRALGTMVLLGALALLAPALAACGASVPTNVRRVLTAADHVQVAGIDAFVAWDDLHQGAIAERDLPVEDRRAMLDAYRKERTKIVAAFSALAHVSHAAKETVDAFAAGTVKDVDWTRLVVALAEAARALRDIGKVVGFVVPGLEDIIGSSP